MEDYKIINSINVMVEIVHFKLENQNRTINKLKRSKVHLSQFKIRQSTLQNISILLSLSYNDSLFYKKIVPK